MGEGKEFSKPPASKGRGFAYSKPINKFVYIGTEENKDLIVEDGEPSKRRFERIDFVSFLPDQKTIVYKAKEKESEFLVVGGKEHKRYRMIRDIRFSDSSDIYYLATDGKTEFLVINGREQQRFAGGVYYYCLSKDGRRVITIGNDRKNILVTVDNKTERFPLMKRTRALFCRFAPDSSGYAFLAPDRENPDNTALFLNGTKIGVYSEILWSSNPESVAFSPDSTKFAYVVREGNKETLYINDRKLATHDRFYKVLFSPDSEHIVYSYQDRDEAIGFSIGLDGKALRSISSLSESPDGPPFIFDGSDRVRYIYEDNSGFYYVEEVIN
jgi:WD40 repeat protein